MRCHHAILPDFIVPYSGYGLFFILRVLAEHFAPVLHDLYPDASRNVYYRRITAEPFTLPDSSVFQYSPKTLSKWVSLYQNGGIDSLMPQEHSDKDSTRVLSDTAIEEIFRIKEAFPRLNATQIHRHLVEESLPQ